LAWCPKSSPGIEIDLRREYRRGAVTVIPARLRLIDITAGGGPYFGAAMREGRARVARRLSLNVTGPDGLEWTVRRLLLPLAMRPYPPSEMIDLSHPDREVAAVLPLGFIVVPALLPFLPLVLLCRALRLLPWTIEARTYPWGKRFPSIVFAYEIRGRDETRLALEEIAAALERGDGAPAVKGAERLR
jgi:hypothetical protein